MSDRYLNSFTILSFNPNNKYISLSCETYFLDKINHESEDSEEFEDSEDSESNSNLSNSNIINEDDETFGLNNNNRFWIVEINGKNKIKIISDNEIDQYNSIKIGPFFSIDIAVLYLNYFNEIGL